MTIGLQFFWYCLEFHIYLMCSSSVAQNDNFQSYFDMFCEIESDWECNYLPMPHHFRKICPSLHLGTLLFETFEDLLQYVEKCSYYFCRSYNFFWFIILEKHAFRPFRPILTSVVSVVSLWPSEEDEVTNSNLRFREFVYTIFILLVLNIHFEIIFLFFYISIKQLFSYLIIFSYCWCFEITLVIILFY